MRRLHTLLVPIILAALLPFLTGAVLINPFVFGTVVLQTASDNFNAYADGALLESQTNWASVTGSIKIVNPGSAGRFMGNTSSANTCVRYTAGTWSANQSVTIFIRTNNTTNYVGAAVRCSGSGGTGACYRAIFSGVNGSIFVSRLNGGVNTDITSYATTGLVVNDQMRLSVTGSGSSTRLHIEKFSGGSWSDIVAALDPGGTYISSGNPGVATYTTGTTTEMGGDDWSATDL